MKQKVLAAPYLKVGEKYFMLARFANPTCGNNLDSFWVQCTLKGLWLDNKTCEVMIEGDKKVFLTHQYSLFMEQET